MGAVMGIASKIPHGRKVLLSLEDKSTKERYPEDGFCWKSRSRASILLFIIVVL